MSRKTGFLFLICCLLLVSFACSAPAQLAELLATSTNTPTATATPTSTSTSTDTPTVTPTSTHTPTPTSTPTATLTPTATHTSTPSITPTYAVIRGVVNEEHVMCFYGPSKAYLYKYGLLGGNRLEIIGFLPDTGYIEIRAIGGNNPCWMNMKFMDIQGDIQTVPTVDPYTLKLPRSPFYGALGYVAAHRKGNEVTISWDALVLRAGDDSEQEPYLVETWVCQSGKLIFIPLGVYQTQATVIDEPGCDQPSFGRVYGVEKHGYTPYLKINWPPYED